MVTNKDEIAESAIKGNVNSAIQKTSSFFVVADEP